MESWRSVVGEEGRYEVSDQGRVRSVDRTMIDAIGRARRLKGVLLKHSVTNGYLCVDLCKGSRLKKVHILVAEAFIGPRLNGLDVCHGDGERTNNKASNLRYGTRSENMQDASEHGTMSKPKGEKSPCAKLSLAQAVAIKSMNLSERKTAAIFGVSRGAVSAIRNGRSWKDLGIAA